MPLSAAIVDIPAVRLCILAAGLFFMTGLLTGVWKWRHIARSPQATAPAYVDIAHRAALQYSFAAILLAQFAALSEFSARTNVIAAALPLVFFAAAIGGYILHGLLQDTDNQFRAPQRIGALTLPRGAMSGFMWLLVAAEIGGFAVLLAGTLRALRLF